MPLHTAPVYTAQHTYTHGLRPTAGQTVDRYTTPGVKTQE